MNEQRRLEEDHRIEEQRRLLEKCRKAETPQINGDMVTFGMYPQSLVINKSIIEALGDFNRNTWTSYKYYNNGRPQNFMYYIDKVYKSNKYRGVYFNKYRPDFMKGESLNEITNQEKNGYLTKKVYWFKYEPISWKIVNNKNGYIILVSELILDSQQIDKVGNNYKNCQIRTWLNDTFLNTAFSAEQQKIMDKALVSNTVKSFGLGMNEYTNPRTNDKVWLLSYNEVNKYFKAKSCNKIGTDYALSQGLIEFFGFSTWWLRSPILDERDMNMFVSVDDLMFMEKVYYICNGVVPAIKIKL